MEWWNSLSKEDRAELSEMLKEEMVELAEEGIVCI